MVNFEIKKDKAWEFRFNLIIDWESILSSEWYKAKAWCENGIRSVKENSSQEKRYELKETNSWFRFNLKAANWEVIWTSLTYLTEEKRKEAIDKIMIETEKAEIIENL